jgi:UDP-N-acetylglucosamine--N-acetylmuramyl-(pentapeptide) pyrophosphoryl-undecaprenol N-acetylglucosamine transferase
MRTTFLFAGGGTGGHIFPALAIHEQIQELAGRSGRDVRSLFICSSRPLDAQILTREGVAYRVNPAQPFGLRPRGLCRFVRAWGASLRSARGAIREARQVGEVQVVAMGGFVAAPVARAASVERAPVLLVNMDAIPGKANRWVASMAQRIVTSAPVKGLDWERIPPIVRRSAVGAGTPAACRAELGLDPARPTLLVTGASQGARSINRFMMRLVRDRSELLRMWQVIHQSGGAPGVEDEPLRQAYAAAGIPALVQPFYEGMGTLWGAADLALSRAGAGSVAEAWANQTPTIFLPYPYHRDEHQKYNAQPLVEAGGAVVVRDLISEEANLGGHEVGNAGSLGAVLAELVHDTSRRDAMRAGLRGLGPAEGALRVARILLE